MNCPDRRHWSGISRERGSIYALGAAADTTGNRVIWRKLGAGHWTRQAATGEFLAASFDQATYAVPGVGP